MRHTFAFTLLLLLGFYCQAQEIGLNLGEQTTFFCPAKGENIGSQYKFSPNSFSLSDLQNGNIGLYGIIPLVHNFSIGLTADRRSKTYSIDYYPVSGPSGYIEHSSTLNISDYEIGMSLMKTFALPVIDIRPFVSISYIKNTYSGYSTSESATAIAYDGYYGNPYNNRLTGYHYYTFGFAGGVVLHSSAIMQRLSLRLSYGYETTTTPVQYYINSPIAEGLNSKTVQYRGKLSYLSFDLMIALWKGNAVSNEPVLQ